MPYDCLRRSPSLNNLHWKLLDTEKCLRYVSANTVAHTLSLPSRDLAPLPHLTTQVIAGLCNLSPVINGASHVCCRYEIQPRESLVLEKPSLAWIWCLFCCEMVAAPLVFLLHSQWLKPKPYSTPSRCKRSCFLFDSFFKPNADLCSKSKILDLSHTHK